jgi:hypothetical protein
MLLLEMWYVQGISVYEAWVEMMNNDGIGRMRG